MRDMWSKLPFPLEFKIYLFNVTNPADIANGEKPIVEEIGPYFYDEWKEKVNLVDRDEDDTVEYNQRITWHFNASRSNGLTGDEELVFPHLAILGMMMITVSEKPTMVGVAAKAVDSIYKKPSSVFVRATAKEIMFDGLPVDCSVKDFAGSAVCALLKAQGKDLVPLGDDKYKFSIFGHKNGTISAEKMRVYRGYKNPKDVGRVLEWKNESALTIWAGDECNAFNGTDSTIFHPFLYQDEDVVSFSSDICRSLSARFQHPTEVQGIRTNRYSADFGDQSSVPEEKCFCPTPETCLKKGAMDLYKCVGTPVVATLPHFYLADPSYLETVSGLHPVKEDHEISIDFEPMTGTPLIARKRLQFNMFIMPIEKFKLMKNFPNALLPLFWVEEGVELGDDIIKKLKGAFKLITIVTCVKWTMVFLGLGLGSAAGFLEYKRRQLTDKLEVTPIPAGGTIRTTISAGKNGDEKKWPPNISTLQAAAVPATLDGSF
ncbi:sensory neuron membrane protein 1 isoform X2 [Athalia rosae]|nr:sensory neuron membrane protein 1 isoform X2 [Athalia rosae]